jgi:hypothetical protein
MTLPHAALAQTITPPDVPPGLDRPHRADRERAGLRLLARRGQPPPAR